MEVDDYDKLDEIADKALNSGLAHTKQCLCFWRYDESFTGKELVQFLNDQYGASGPTIAVPTTTTSPSTPLVQKDSKAADAKDTTTNNKEPASPTKEGTEDVGFRLAARLFDSDLIRLTSDSKKPGQFRTQDIYTFTSLKNPYGNFSMARIFELQQNAQAIKDAMFAVGKFAVTRVFCVLLSGKLHMFRGRTSKVVRVIAGIDSKCTYYVTKGQSKNYGQWQGQTRKETSQKPSQSKLGSEDDNDWLPQDIAFYLNINTPMRDFTLAVFNQDTRDRWTKGLAACGARLVAGGGSSDQTGKGEITEKSELTLRDVLDSPEFRNVFIGFLEDNLALENVKFLEAVQGYKALQLLEKRQQQAEKIYNTFVDEKSTELVNIDSTSRTKLIKRYKANDFALDLFDDAERCIYLMTERDIFVRFVSSEQYKKMLENYKQQKEGPAKHKKSAADTPKMQGEHGQGSPSVDKAAMSINRTKTEMLFVMKNPFSDVSMDTKRLEKMRSFRIAFVEDLKELEKISDTLQKVTSLFTEEKAKNKHCAQGKAIVDWIMANTEANIRPAATAIGQRLVDAFFLRHVTDDCDFEDSTEWYTFERGPLQQGVSAPELKMHLQQGNKPSMDSSLLLQGLKSVPVYGILHITQALLYIYRNETSARPLMCLALRSAYVSLMKEEEEEKQVEDWFGGAKSMAISTPEAKEPKKAAVYYLLVGMPKRGFKLRIDSEQEKDAWLTALRKVEEVLAAFSTPQPSGGKDKDKRTVRTQSGMTMGVRTESGNLLLPAHWRASSQSPPSQPASPLAAATPSPIVTMSAPTQQPSPLVMPHSSSASALSEIRHAPASPTAEPAPSPASASPVTLSPLAAALPRNRSSSLDHSKGKNRGISKSMAFTRPAHTHNKLASSPQSMSPALMSRAVSGTVSASLLSRAAPFLNQSSSPFASQSPSPPSSPLSTKLTTPPNTPNIPPLASRPQNQAGIKSQNTRSPTGGLGKSTFVSEADGGSRGACGGSGHSSGQSSPREIQLSVGPTPDKDGAIVGSLPHAQSHTYMPHHRPHKSAGGMSKEGMLSNSPVGSPQAELVPGPLMGSLPLPSGFKSLSPVHSRTGSSGLGSSGASTPSSTTNNASTVPTLQHLPSRPLICAAPAAGCIEHSPSPSSPSSPMNRGNSPGVSPRHSPRGMNESPPHSPRKLGEKATATSAPASPTS